MQFADLAGDAGGPVRPAVLDELADQLDDAVGAFVEGEGVGQARQVGQPGLPPLLVGQEALEVKAVAGDATGRQGGHEGGRPGQATDGNPRRPAGPHQQEARVADAGRTRVGDQRVGRPVLQLVDQGGHDAVFVVSVVGPQGGVDPVVLQQGAAGAGVLGQHQVGGRQYGNGAAGDVFAVADGGRNEVQHGGAGKKSTTARGHAGGRSRGGGS